MESIAYKIEAASAWALAKQIGIYHGSPLDKADGFIHLSALAQLQRTFELYFDGQSDLIVATIDLDKISNMVKWEASRGGALFPHIYGSLPMSAVLCVHPILNENGQYALPKAIMELL
jgi:uncharacterized protein (DUF952 family)